LQLLRSQPERQALCSARERVNRLINNDFIKEMWITTLRTPGISSDDGKSLRDELLTRRCSSTSTRMNQDRQWIAHYNAERPHSRLEYQIYAAYAEVSHRTRRRVQETRNQNWLAWRQQQAETTKNENTQATAAKFHQTELALISSSTKLSVMVHWSFSEFVNARSPCLAGPLPFHRA
jgi:hypothetical protein